MADVLSFVPRPDFAASKAGVPYSTIDNFRKMIRAYGIVIRYNEIKKEIEVQIPGTTFLPDNHLNCCMAQLTSIAESYKMKTAHINKFMLLVADENKYNPVAEWIESKPWDHVSRIDQFCQTLESVNRELADVLIRRWMISAVAALYEPEGVSAGGMLVLLGKQYLGKTNWFRNLVPVEKRAFIQDSMSVNPHDRDTFMPCLENWLVELGEIDATFKRADIAALKAFINKQRDITRLSYAAANSRFPRRTIFFGSVDKKSYLTDPAGNRRFWTVECTAINHTHGLDMQQVWAEFATMYHNGEPWLLTSEEHHMLTGANKDYELVNPMEERILTRYNWSCPCQDWKTATQILEDLGYRNITHSDATTCAMLIRKLNGDTCKKIRGIRYLALPMGV